MINFKGLVRALMGAILFIFAFQAQAQTKTFGDWEVGLTDDGKPFAFNVNAAGDVLLKICDVNTATCRWSQGTQISCDENESTPALFNSPKGAAVDRVICAGSYASGKKTMYRYDINDPDQFDTIVNGSSGIVGLATPLASGQFNVSRFSLKGGKQAIEALIQLALEMGKRKNKQQPANQRL